MDLQNMSVLKEMFEKAVTVLQSVLTVDPENEEAKALLAQYSRATAKETADAIQ